MSCRSSWGRAFHTLGPAAEKLLSPKLLCVRGTTQVLSLADRSRRRPLSATSCTSSAKYWEACPDSDLCIKQPRLRNNGSDRAQRNAPGTKRTTLMCTDFSRPDLIVSSCRQYNSISTTLSLLTQRQTLRLTQSAWLSAAEWLARSTRSYERYFEHDAMSDNWR